MSYYDIGLYVVLALAAILGYTFGFAKALKKLTKGIKGLIICVVLCFAFGGFLQQLSFAQDLIALVDAQTASFPAFVSFVPFGLVAFYLVLGIIFLIARAILISVVDAIFGKNEHVMVIGRFFGLVIYAAYYAALILVALAVLKMFESTGFAQNILGRIAGSNLEQIYLQNPVIF